MSTLHLPLVPLRKNPVAEPWCQPSSAVSWLPASSSTALRHGNLWVGLCTLSSIQGSHVFLQAPFQPSERWVSVLSALSMPQLRGHLLAWFLDGSLWSPSSGSDFFRFKCSQITPFLLSSGSSRKQQQVLNSGNKEENHSQPVTEVQRGGHSLMRRDQQMEVAVSSERLLNSKVS